MADSADSIKKYREILDLDPGSRVFVMLAEELCAAGEWEEAVEVCRNGLHFHPEHLGARILLGRALMEMGDPDESERILSNVAEEIRKNSFIFKLLSELVAISGKMESAGEYARIYEAFGNTPPLQAPTSESEGPGAVAAPPKVPAEPDDSNVEAVENLDAEASDVQVELPSGEEITFSDILRHLAQRLDGRLPHTAEEPPAILSENDKDMLKERIIALLGA